MQRLRIDEALVCHAIALEADVEYGNALLIEQLRGHPNLYPCWVMRAATFGDLPDAGAGWERARAAGRAVRSRETQPLQSRGVVHGPLLGPLERAPPRAPRLRRTPLEPVADSLERRSGYLPPFS